MHDQTHTITIEQALAVFVQGFAVTRSFTHPFLAERVGPLWVMRDAPRKRGDYRSEEWVAHDITPTEVDTIVRQQRRGRFVICMVCGNEQAQEPVRAEFKRLGYQLVTTEPLMIHPLTQIPHFAVPGTIERVLTVDMANQVAKAARSRQILAEHLVAEAPLRQYVALIDGELVGWVRSIVVRANRVGDSVAGDATWCSNMFVRPEFRRRGIGRALLSRMLQDDVAHGARVAVLLASHTGALLYPVVGYERIGTLLLYAPGKQ